MRKIYIAIVMVLMMSGNALFAGGGWPIPKGKGYLKLSQYVIRSNSYFTPSGDIVDISTASIYISSIYGEYGLTDRLGVTAYMPFFSRATLNEQVSTNGTLLAEGDAVNSLGDFDLAVKYGLIVNKPIVVSATLTFGLPLGNDAGGETQVLQTGDGEFNVMLGIEASRSFGQGKGYINTLAAYNDRSENFSDELRIGAEIGYRFAPKVSGALKILSVNSLQNGSDLETPANGIFSNNIEYLAITPEVNYFVKDDFGISGAIGFAASGKRVLASPSFSIGLFKSF
ncbi:hypothetical protein [Roseivirga misakiensis]|uniref:Transporter n=1 Tax=Roseivirga misakiensis TaxID=1563681 RepID=A0A1E5T680_9BACT|nr:hypothetical protein [Roseivirga misakiensis]OEK06848.1 hypothetical protein BFP71_04105 [Roseivirga misakiensis]